MIIILFEKFKIIQILKNENQNIKQIKNDENEDYYIDKEEKEFK